jgi:hypothetical protein
VSRGIYSIVYRTLRKKPELSLRVLSEAAAKDFLVIRGDKATRILKNILTVLDAYAIKYSATASASEEIYELPADVGHASLLFMMMVYSAKRPDKYVSLFEKLLAGKIPLSTHLKVFVDIAVELSETTSRAKRRRATLDGRIIRSLSPIMRNLARILSRFGE